MTLKEKFDKISCSDCNMPYCDIKCTMLSEYELNHLEKIADDFAIGFAEFLEIYQGGAPNKNVLTEILQIYKKEKGL